MSKVVLHIGTHKTATTTIQDMFHKNAELLEQHGVIYPRIGRVTGHHGLVYDWGRLPPVYKLDVSSLDAFTWIAKEHAHKDATVFLSSEEFSRGDPKAAVDFAAVRERLAEFDEIEVICVLRPQWQFLQSIYLELSKTKIPARPPKMIEPALETGMSQGLWIDYNLLLDRLEETFEPEQITFLDFETSVKAEGGIIGTMLRHLGVDLETTALETVNDGASNVSPEPLVTWIANLASEPAPAPAWLLKHAQKSFDLQYTERVKSTLFSQREVDQLTKHFAVLNDRLETRHRQVQPDFQMTQPDIGKLGVFRNNMPSQIWVRMCRLMVQHRAPLEKAAAEKAKVKKATVANKTS